MTKAKKLSQRNLKKAKVNKEHYLQGKPFILPRRLDIHRTAYNLSVTPIEERKSWWDGDTYIHNAGFGGESLGTSISVGRIWLIVEKRWLNQKLKTQVGFHELDFDIQVDTWGRVTKEINGETVKVDYSSGL